MSDVPARFKKKAEDFTVAEHAERMAAERRGETYKPETDEYKHYRNKVLEAGGLEADRTEDKPLEELDVQEHFERLRQR